MWHDSGWGAGDWLLMTLLMTLLWAGLAVLVVLVVRALRPVGGPPESPGPSHPQPPVSPAEAVLRDRFARGEIDVEEFERRRAVLRSSASA